MSQEVWKDIKCFEGWYQVSDLGNVRSVDRIIEQWSMYGHYIKRRIKGRLIVPTDNGNGYMIVCLRKNQRKENHYVHRLVAEAFLPNPNALPAVNHIDYNRSNNIASNLEWTTNLENTRYSIPRMQKIKASSKPTATGEKYITIRKGKYRLNIQHGDVRIDRTFATLNEAVTARGVLIGGIQYYAG